MRNVSRKWTVLAAGVLCAALSVSYTPHSTDADEPLPLIGAITDSVRPGERFYTEGSSSSCSLGFLVEDTSGRRGFLTAGHCDQSTTERCLSMGERAQSLSVCEMSRIEVPYGDGTAAGRFVHSDIIRHYIYSTKPLRVWRDSSAQEGESEMVRVVGVPLEDSAVVMFDGDVDASPEVVDGHRVSYPLSADTVRDTYIGSLACKQGALSGFTCGVTRDVDSNGMIRVDAHPSDDTFRVCMKGDSGGPVFVFGKSWEIHPIGITAYADRFTWSPSEDTPGVYTASSSSCVAAPVVPMLQRWGLRIVPSD